MSGCGPNELAHDPGDATIDAAPDPQESRPMMTTFPRHARMLAAAAIAIAAAGGPAQAGGDSSSSRPGSAPPSARPWLEVKLPAAPAAGAATARLKLKLGGNKQPSDYAGLKISIEGAAARTVPLGDRAELVIAASATAPYRFE